MDNVFTMDYLKAKAENVWDAYLNFKEDVYELASKAEDAGIVDSHKLDFCDEFIDFNEKLGMALEEVFGIKCFDEE